MSQRNLHIVHLLIRRKLDGEVRFLLYSHGRWVGPDGRPLLALPTKKTVPDALAVIVQGTPLEPFVDAILQEDLGLADETYALEEELEPVLVSKVLSPGQSAETDYLIYPVDVWVDPTCIDDLQARTSGEWLTCGEALGHPRISPTAREVLRMLPQRERDLKAAYTQCPAKAQQPEAPRLILEEVPARPSMGALANKWLCRNLQGVRHLRKQTLDEILDAGNRAFNLRVADPYLRYQMQGEGFTWSFFTDKDRQDTHVHGAPVVEIYGVLEGRMEIWWKPYHHRGSSAWSHRILEAGDWVEVGPLQCHIVHWLGEGKGVVFKAGPGSLIGVGRLGEKGKTPCTDNCACQKHPEVLRLEEIWHSSK